MAIYHQTLNISICRNLLIIGRGEKWNPGMAGKITHRDRDEARLGPKVALITGAAGLPSAGGSFASPTHIPQDPHFMAPGTHGGVMVDPDKPPEKQLNPFHHGFTDKAEVETERERRIRKDGVGAKRKQREYEKNAKKLHGLSSIGGGGHDDDGDDAGSKNLNINDDANTMNDDSGSVGPLPETEAGMTGRKIKASSVWLKNKMKGVVTNKVNQRRKDPQLEKIKGLYGEECEPRRPLRGRIGEPRWRDESRNVEAWDDSRDSQADGMPCGVGVHSVDHDMLYQYLDGGLPKDDVYFLFSF